MADSATDKARSDTELKIQLGVCYAINANACCKQQPAACSGCMTPRNSFLYTTFARPAEQGLTETHLASKFVVLKVRCDNVPDFAQSIYSSFKLGVQANRAVHPQTSIRQLDDSPSAIDIQTKPYKRPLSSPNLFRVLGQYTPCMSPVIESSASTHFGEKAFCRCWLPVI